MRKFLTSFLAVALLALAFLTTTACFDKISGPTIINDNQNNNGNPTPTTSPSPSVQACEIGSLDLGTVADKTTVAPGQAVDLSLSVYGQQGVELNETCRNSISVSYETPTGPCGPVEGSWYAAKLRALSTATAGQVCATRAISATGKYSGYVTVTVVP